MTRNVPVLDRPLASLYRREQTRSRRASSWDRTGANLDFIRIGAGETATLLETTGSGCITHLYCALVLPDLTEYRDAIVRCYWDGADQPSVAVPLGDFFGIAHGRVRPFVSAVSAINEGLGASHGLNLYLPMPFSKGARVTLENRGGTPLGGPLGAFWYHIEYETYAEEAWPAEDVLRFHAVFRQERPTRAVGELQNVSLHDAVNLDGAENYVALDTVGEGRMAGLLLEVDNLHENRWYGEGDDMVFVDGETWPPSIHGTGSEEIFGGGACPSQEFSGPYSGFHLVESDDYEGLVGMYRWYLHDPIHYSRSLRWTIEHGHANNFSNHYASVAYFYQTPIRAADPLPSRDAMRPRLEDGYEQARNLLFETTAAARRADRGGAAAHLFLKACQAGRAFYTGHWRDAIEALERFRRTHGV